jgi:hypothetical protein
MASVRFLSSTVGWVALATGIASILATVLIILFYTVGGPFGTLNDIFNGLAGILSGVLAWTLRPAFHSNSSTRWVMPLLAAIGAIMVVIGSILIIFDITGWVLAGWYTALGNAMIGIWLLTFSYSTRQDKTLPSNLSMLGLVAGGLMAIGAVVIPAIILGIDSTESTPWYVNLGYAGFLGTYLLYPSWSLWLGGAILSGKKSRNLL